MYPVTLNFINYIIMYMCTTVIYLFARLAEVGLALFVSDWEALIFCSLSTGRPLVPLALTWLSPLPLLSTAFPFTEFFTGPLSDSRVPKLEPPFSAHGAFGGLELPNNGASEDFEAPVVLFETLPLCAPVFDCVEDPEPIVFDWFHVKSSPRVHSTCILL